MENNNELETGGCLRKKYGMVSQQRLKSVRESLPASMRGYSPHGHLRLRLVAKNAARIFFTRKEPFNNFLPEISIVDCKIASPNVNVFVGPSIAYFLKRCCTTFFFITPEF